MCFERRNRERTSRGFHFANYRRRRGSKSAGFEEEADWEATGVMNAGVGDVAYQRRQQDGEGGLGGGVA